MIVRTAKPKDVARMLELMRVSPTGAQWPTERFAEMVGEAARLVLVVEVEANGQNPDAPRQQQIPRSARNDKPEGEHIPGDWLRRRGLQNEGLESAGFDPGAMVEGFVVAHQIGPECEIENVVVNPQLRRRGFGKLLLDEILKRVQEAGCEAVFLEVRESNRAARALYEKCGFREIGRRVKYYVQPQEDAVLYRSGGEGSASKMVQT